ncbi:hypothetical protein KRMM14A1004_52260 [Krasilnikovia sp. MM14-A1004]
MADSPHLGEPPQPAEAPHPGEPPQPAEAPQPGEPPQPAEAPQPGEPPQPAEAPQPGEPPRAAGPPPDAGGYPPRPPGGGQVPPTAPPPWFGAADGPSFSRERLIRPATGRYIAGVCAAIGRATNTDPVLWRVLLVVLGFFGGVGVLLYLIGWLVIPAEGDTGSPIESLLGRGRSRMAPLTVVLLGAATAVTFAFIVQDGFRATLLGAAVLLGAALLIRRNSGGAVTGSGGAAAGSGGAAAGSGGFPAGSGGFAAAAPGADPDATSAFAAAMSPGTAPAATASTPGSDAPPAPPGYQPPTAAGPMPPHPAGTMPEPPGYLPPTAAGPMPPAPPGYLPPLHPKPGGHHGPMNPPPGGYRPPFAPHGPWAGGAGQAPYEQAPQPRAPKPAKPPRERSKLGRITFFAVVMVMGVLALADLSGASIPVPGYFAAALATIGLGLLIGTWFGRARGLIALALITTVGLLISSGAQQVGGHIGSTVYRPATLAAVADRYDFTVGDATLDLRDVNFAGQTQETTVEMKLGQLRVLLPEKVDTTASVHLDTGRAFVFGREWDGDNLAQQQVVDLGPDGAGGGTLKLTIKMNAGNVEVTR